MFAIRLKSLFLVLALSSLLPGCGATEGDELDSEAYAVELLEKNGLEAVDIERVVRNSSGTVVWIATQFAGLPIFFASTGYSFDQDGAIQLIKGTSKPDMLGAPPAPASAFPADHEPDISAEQASAAYLERAGQHKSPRLDTSEPLASPILGFHDVHMGTFGSADSPEYRLAWLITPEHERHPLAIIDAENGDVLLFDSGARTMRPPSPMPPVKSSSSEPPPWPGFVGEWWSPRCARREYTRIIRLYADSTFKVSDLVAPCPEGARCIWSGIIDRHGTWLERGGNLIELAELVDVHEDTRRAGPQAEPLPGALHWDAQENVLREALPGEPAPCEYKPLPSTDLLPEAEPDPINPLNPSASSACSDAVQGRIAWNEDGNRNWNERNVAGLCGDADSAAPAHCFDQVLTYDAAPRGNPWHWQEAIALCRETADAEKPIHCFNEQMGAGSGKAAAIRGCLAS